jgi:hypothetical protein
MYMMAGHYLLQFIGDLLIFVSRDGGYLLGYLSDEFASCFLTTTIICVKVFVTSINQRLFE